MNNIKTYYFPYVRKGLGNCILEEDALGAELENGTTERGIIQITAKLKATVAGSKDGEKVDILQSKRVDLVGPGDVLKISSHAVLKCIPADASVGFSKDYMPYIEFWEPDFLWRYTPAAPKVDGEDGEKARLRPWLALIVCESSRCKLAYGPDGECTVSLTVENEDTYAGIFIDPTDTWRTAHVQGYTPDEPDFCRLIATRRFNGKPATLKEGTEYTVMLVPAFETGRLKGLGLACDSIAAQKSSWENTLAAQKNSHPDPLSFPVYYLWRYTTGGESFDTMVQKLQVTNPGDSAISIDVTHMGNGFDYSALQQGRIPERKIMEMPAAIKTLGQKPGIPFPDISEKNEKILYGRLRALLEKNPVFNDNADDLGQVAACDLAEEDDGPWVTPPVYGARHAMVLSVDGTGNDKRKIPWVAQLNLDTRYRAIAGLGKKVVQLNQEEFVNRAWKQIDVVQELNRRLRMALASYKNNISTQSRMYEWMNGGADKFIANLMHNLPSAKDMTTSNGISLSSILKDKQIPGSFASASFQRTNDRVAKIAEGMDTTTLMEHIAGRQTFKFDFAAPDYGIGARSFLDMAETLYKTLLDYSLSYLFTGSDQPLSRIVDIEMNGDIENWTFKRRPFIEDHMRNYDNTYISRYTMRLPNGDSEVVEFTTIPDGFKSGPVRRDTFGKKPYLIYPYDPLDYYFVHCFGGERHTFPKAERDLRNEQKYYIETGSVINEVDMFEKILGFIRKDGLKYGRYGTVKNEKSTEYRVFGIHKDIYTKYFGTSHPVTLIGARSIHDDLMSNIKNGIYITSYDPYDANAATAWEDISGRYPLGNSNNGDIESKYCYHHGFYSDVYAVGGRYRGLLSIKSPDIGRLGLSEEKQNEYLAARKEVTNTLLAGNKIEIDPLELDKEGKVQVFETPADYFNYFMAPFLDPDRTESSDLWRNEALLAMIKRIKEFAEDLEDMWRKSYRESVNTIPVPTEEKVNDLKASFLDNTAYNRVKKVASDYYKTFFANERLVDRYLDELLSSKYPIMAYPIFPEPAYYYLTALSEKFLLPCICRLPDNSVAAFESNSAFIEAFLCGMNTEMGEELLWREYPTDRRGSYFRKFWDSEAAPADILKESYFDISPLHTWKGDLGSNMASGKATTLIFAIKSKLLKEFPDTQIYLHKAAMNVRTSKDDRSGWFSKGPDAEMMPVMEAWLSEDVYMVGFKTSFIQALGVPPDQKGKSRDWGYMLTFKQREEDLNFMLNKYEAEALEQSPNSARYAQTLIDAPTLYGIHLSHFITL